MEVAVGEGEAVSAGRSVSGVCKDAVGDKAKAVGVAGGCAGVQATRAKTDKATRLERISVFDLYIDFEPRFGLYSRCSGCSAVGSAPRLGRGGRRFKSAHPDQKFKTVGHLADGFPIQGMTQVRPPRPETQNRQQLGWRFSHSGNDTSPPTPTRNSKPSAIWAGGFPIQGMTQQLFRTLGQVFAFASEPEMA